MYKLAPFKCLTITQIYDFSKKGGKADFFFFFAIIIKPQMPLIELNVLNPEYLFNISNSELFEAIQINASYLVLSSLKRHSTAGPGSAF